MSSFVRILSETAAASSAHADEHEKEEAVVILKGCFIVFAFLLAFVCALLPVKVKGCKTN